MKTNFSKYFDDQINDCNWEAVAQKDGSYSILDGDGTGIANDIMNSRTAYMMANAQRFFQLLDDKQRNIIWALIEQQKKETTK